MNENILFKSELVEVGAFTISPNDPLFDRHGYVDHPIIVFPKTSIWIQHEGSLPFVSDPTLINFYNKGQVYKRFAISEVGDICHWFQLNEESLSEFFARDSAHFSCQNTHCPADLFMLQMQLLKQLHDAEAVNELDVEEKVFSIFHALSLNNVQNDKTFAKHTAKHQQLVECVKATLHEDLSANISLKDLAQLHHTSPYHLSRVFKMFNGEGINQYRQRLRLHHLSLELQHTSKDLIDLAFDFGFSSHSHMSASFKSTFGVTPSERREQIHTGVGHSNT